MPNAPGLVAELARLQQLLAPLDARIGDDALDSTMAAANSVRDRERAVIHALARSSPENAREALAVALVVLEGVLESDRETGGADGSGSELPAMRSVVEFLANAAGIAAQDLNIFLDELEEAQIGSADRLGGAIPTALPGPAAEAAQAQFDDLWAQFAQMFAAMLAGKDENGDHADLTRLQRRIIALEQAVLTAPPRSDRDALAIAFILVAYRSDLDRSLEPDLRRGLETLKEHLMKRTGATAADLGLRFYEQDETRLPSVRSSLRRLLRFE